MDVAVVGQADIEPGAKAFGWLQKIVVGIFAAAICAGTFIPLYTDEIGWRFQERAGLDGVDKLFNDVCGANTLAVPPFFMMPVRWYSAFFNTLFADPLYVRLSGVLYALCWLAMLLVLIRRVARDRAGSHHSRARRRGAHEPRHDAVPAGLEPSRTADHSCHDRRAAVRLDARRGFRCGNVERGCLAAFAGHRGLRHHRLSYHAKAAFVLPVFLACLFLRAGAPRPTCRD